MSIIQSTNPVDHFLKSVWTQHLEIN